MADAEAPITSPGSESQAVKVLARLAVAYGVTVMAAGAAALERGRVVRRHFPVGRISGARADLMPQTDPQVHLLVAQAGRTSRISQLCSTVSVKGSEPCVPRAQSLSVCNCAKDGSRPPEVCLQGPASNRPVLLRSKGVVVSDWGKGVTKTSGE